MIDNIKRILVYTFIYEGVTNWKEAYATVTIKQTGGDDFIIHMDEFSVKQKMFAISEIVNIGDAMSVEKKALLSKVDCGDMEGLWLIANAIVRHWESIMCCGLID